jgi:hypothetical protein
MLENGLEECNCRKKKCERYGKCEECIAYHKSNKYHALPYCKRKGNKKSDNSNRQIEDNL